MSSWLPGILAFKALSNDLGPREAGRDLQIHSNLNAEPGCMVGSGGKGSWAQVDFTCHGVSSQASNSTLCPGITLCRSRLAAWPCEWTGFVLKFRNVEGDCYSQAAGSAGSIVNSRLSRGTCASERSMKRTHTISTTGPTSFPQLAMMSSKTMCPSLLEKV